MLYLNKKAWSPYWAGLVIGLLQIPAFLLMDTALGASSAYVKIVGHLAVMVDPAVADIKYFAKYMASQKYVWQLALIIGIALGAFVSMRLSGAKRKAVSPIWGQVMGTTSLPSRAVFAFIGGFLMLFGARLAGGCTSGHGISGLAQFAAGSSIAVAGMFAGGIALAMLLRPVKA